MGFAASFSYPFFTRTLLGVGSAPSELGGVTSSIPQSITLDGFVFPVEVKEWRSGPQDTFRDTIVANDQPSDALFNAKGAWSRYRYGWHHGSGQSLSDLDELADPYRFDDAYGVRWHEKLQLTLQPTTTLTQASAVTNGVLCRSADYVFAGLGSALYRTTDLITWTAMTPPGGTVLAMSSDGTDLYVATSTLMGKYVGAATSITAFATPVTGNCTNVAFLSNRLLVAKDNVLYEVAAAGTLTSIKPHYQPAFRWTALFNIGSRMYIGGFAGSRSELYTLTTDSAGLLVQSQEAAPLPIGEKLRAGISFAGSAMLATSAGVRFAQVSGDGTLSYGPLIDAPGDTRCATADGRFVFTGWSDMGAGRTGVARMVLDDEVAPLQPAYCGDVYEASVSAAVTGVVRLNGLTAFLVDGSGVWVESSSTFVGGGELDSGRLSFGTMEVKALIGLDIEFAPLLVGEAIEADVIDENGVIIGNGVQSTVAATRLSIDLNGEQVAFCSVVIRLVGPGTSTPLLYRWRLRGYPIPPPVLQWVLPLIVAEIVLVGPGDGEQRSMDVDAVHTWIEDLWGRRRYTYLRIGTRAYRVRVDNFEWRPTKWTSDGHVPQGLLVVQLVDA